MPQSPSPGQLVALAAQACQEVDYDEYTAHPLPPEVFTDRATSSQVCRCSIIAAWNMHSIWLEQPVQAYSAQYRDCNMQKTFKCFEANLERGSDALPLMVLAISESILSWTAYSHAALTQQTGTGQFNSAVQSSAAKVSFA